MTASHDWLKYLPWKALEEQVMAWNEVDAATFNKINFYR